MENSEITGRLHVVTNETSGKGVPVNLDGPIVVKSAVPKIRQNLLKWNGWGYEDSFFKVNDKEMLEFTGNRYPIGCTQLPHFTRWVQDVFGVELSKKNPSQSIPQSYPDPIISSEFLGAVKQLKVDYSVDGVDRMIRAHGHSLREIMQLKKSTFERIPDIVIWPKCHEDVEKIVRACAEHGAACIPIGGGTNVTFALSCPASERRTIVSLDTSQMNRILWIDRENLLACCESGIIGQDLERELNSRGLTCGHEPDSYEFSSLGGWVATRASGMKKNIYGNIEDIVVRVRMVNGRTEAADRESPESLILERGAQVPRVSCGPDFDHVILGSEGTLGVVTEVVVKVRPIPAVSKYGSVVFPDFDSGVRFMREVAKRRCQPASIRLMDNEQFKFGQALQPEASWGSLLLQGLKHAYVTRIKGFNWDSMCVTTLLFEGESSSQVAEQERKVYEVAKQFGGLPAGDKNGERGYILTFVIAYIRDLGIEYYVVSESFETSVSWDRTIPLCRNVKHRIAQDCLALGVKNYFISCRVTQTYDAGCCVYFYMAFKYQGLKDPVGAYEKIEETAREEIMANGGSLSHHHGIGKMRAGFYPKAVGPAGVALYRAAKTHLDPLNIFAAGNIDPVHVSKL